VVASNSIKKIGKSVVTRGNDGSTPLGVAKPETNPSAGVSARGPPQRAADDLVWGCAAIADYIGVSLTQCQYLIRQKRLPVGRLGPRLIFASRRQLQHHLTAGTQLVTSDATSEPENA
jgi:hypothetical protein